MPIVNYNPRPFALYLAVELQTTVGSILLKDGANNLTDRQVDELIRLKATDGFEFGPAIEVLGEIDSASPVNAPPESLNQALNADIPDIENMTAEDAIDAIEEITDGDVLSLLLEAESAGKKRKTVIAALNEALGVG